jgi:hypothetical protein
MCDLFKSLARIKNQVDNSAKDPWKTMQEKVINTLERQFTQESIAPERFQNITKFFGNILDKINKVVDGSINRKKLDLVADLFTCVVEEVRNGLISQGFKPGDELNLYHGDFVLEAVVEYNPNQGFSSINPIRLNNLEKASITTDQLVKVWQVYNEVGDIYGLSIQELVTYVKKKRERNGLRHDFGNKIKGFAKDRQKCHQPVQLAEFVRRYQLTELVTESEVPLLEHVFRMCWQTMLYGDQQK